MAQGKLRWIAAAACAAGVLSLRPDLPRSGAQPPAAIPLNGGFVQFQFGEGGEEGVSGVFLPTERTAKRRFDQSRQFIEEKRYGEAVRMLDVILEDHEDSFFQPEGRDASFRSLKSEARRLIGELPDAGREAYQLQYGIRAQKMLEDASAAGDWSVVAEVSRRFFHTDAGYEATLLLGQHHLDHQRPLAAALCFQQLVDVPRAAARFEPTLSVLAAASWFRAGMPDQAEQALNKLRENYSGKEISLGGKSRKLAGRGEDALAWLQQTVGVEQASSDARRNQWALFRGDGGRNAESAGGRPLLAPRWRVRTANDPTIEKLVNQMRQSYLRQEIAALPSLHPLAVRDVVLMRTAQHLLAIDFKTGKRIWEVKPRQDESFERLIKLSRSQAEMNQATQLMFGLEQRMWDDAAYGALSSDGERVFVLQDLDLLIGPSNPQIQFMLGGGAVFGARPQATPIGPKTFNRLGAYDLATEGKLVWEVGGPESEVEPLAEAFFLGPPLPLAGNLYVLAEIKGGIRLVVLDARTGQLQWMQQLADLERNIVQDPFRRLAGAAPSFTDGVLVCPTSAGAVVAVDLSTRSLLWAHKYPVRSNQARAQMAMMMMRGYPASQVRANDSWLDASVTIHEGRVLLTPVESDKLTCLNLLDGAEQWQAPRGENLYLACVHQDKVVLVGVNSVTALRLADGKPAWKQESPPLLDGGMPSGRGYYSDGFYYLPLTTAEVVKIDLNTGAIVERAKSREGHVPGNLICYDGEVVSQGVDFLESYYQLEALQDRVARSLKQNPNDAEALARQGELQFDAGQLDQSIASLRRSFESAPNDLTRELLVRSLLEGLRIDFPAHRSAIPELERLLDQPEQHAALVRLTAIGLQHAGEAIPAFENYLKLVDLSEDQDHLERIDNQVSVRQSRWIQAQLASLHAAATDSERQVMDAALAARRADLGPNPTAAQLRNYLHCFGVHSSADAVRQQLAQALLDGESSLECELLLQELENSPDPQYQRAAVALTAKLLARYGRVDDAAIYYRRLAGPLADQVCLDGATGAALVGRLAADDPIRARLAGSYAWPRGKVVASTESPKSQNRTHRRMFPLELRDELGPFFQNAAVSFDQQSQNIIGQDSLGGTQFQIPLAQPNGTRHTYVVNPSLNYGKARGHLLIVSMGYQVLALDTLNSKQASSQNVLWRQDLTDQAPALGMQHHVQIKRINLPGGEARLQAEDEQGRPIGALGPVIPQGLTFQRHRSLVAVDPLTGKTLWIRHDVPQGSDLLGDEQRLLVIPPGASEALVLRPLDGSQLGTCPVPPMSQRLATLGSRIVTLEAGAKGPVLTLLDPWKRQTLWTRAFDIGAKFNRLDERTLGVMQRDGKFCVLSLADGRALVEQQLLPEPQLVDIFMQQADDYFLLITNRPQTPPRDGINISAAPGGLNNPLVSGHVYVFNRATGRPRWQTPASIEQQGLMLPQPNDLPVLVFVRHIVNPNESGPNRTKTSLLCLDKRTGVAVFEKDDFRFGTGFFSLLGETATNTASVQLPSTTVKLQFTDEPVPPEPPAQADLGDQTRARSSSLKVIGSLFKAFGRAAAEVQGGGLRDDELEQDPFGEGEEFEEVEGE